jgi:hypothetical protein
MMQRQKILALLEAAAGVAAIVLMAKSDDFKESKNKTLRLLGNAVQYVVYAVGICFLVPFVLAIVCAPGMLIIIFAVEPLFPQLVEALRAQVVVLCLVSFFLGAMVIWCGTMVSKAWERRRAIEDEIKTVLSIKIVEPPPPSRVERFFGSEGALERVYNRCFGWIEKIENDRLRTVVGSLIFCVIAFLVGRIAVWALGIRLESYLAMIFLPLFCGYMCVVSAIFVGGVVYYAWLAARGIIKWTGQNLPRGLVFRYRQWKLRHGFVKHRSLNWLTALVAIALIIVFVAALKACHGVPDGEEQAEEESPNL